MPSRPREPVWQGRLSAPLDPRARRLNDSLPVDGRLVGDVDFEAVKEVAGWITPNPGGTGPMTVLALMQNLIDATRYQLGLDRATYSV